MNAILYAFLGLFHGWAAMWWSCSFDMARSLCYRICFWMSQKRHGENYVWKVEMYFCLLDSIWNCLFVKYHVSAKSWRLPIRHCIMRTKTRNFPSCGPCDYSPEHELFWTLFPGRLSFPGLQSRMTFCLAKYMSRHLLSSSSSWLEWEDSVVRKNSVTSLFINAYLRAISISTIWLVLSDCPSAWGW